MFVVFCNRNGDKVNSKDNYLDCELMGSTGGENKKFPSEMREWFCFIILCPLQKHRSSQYSHKDYWKYFSEFTGPFGKHFGQEGSPRKRNWSANGGLTLIVGVIKAHHTV